MKQKHEKNRKHVQEIFLKNCKERKRKICKVHTCLQWQNEFNEAIET
jgi:hypothetical protein